MNRTTKIIIVVIALVVIVLLGLRVYQTQRSQTNSVKIGAILPLSGGFASFGEEIQKGIALGIDDFATKGVPVEMVFEDDQSLVPTAIVSAAQKLLTVDKVDAGVTMAIEEARPIMPIFQTGQTPLLILWDSNDSIRNAGDYIFSNGFSTEKTGEVAARYAYEQLGSRKVAIIGHVDPAVEIMSASFKKTFEGLGGHIVFEQAFQPTISDYRTAILGMKQAGADAVYAPLLPPTLVDFLKEARQLKLNAALISAEGVTPDVMKDAGSAAEGVYFTNIFPISDATSSLAEKYEKKYGVQPPDITLVALGYDGIVKIAQAIDLAESSKTSVKTQLDVIFGASRSTDRAEKMYKVVDGQAQLVR